MNISNNGKVISEQIQMNQNRLNMSEAFYLIISKPKAEFTFIVRYVLFNGRKGLTGHMGAWVHDKKNGLDFVVHKNCSSEKVIISNDKVDLQIGGCSINPGRLSGTLYYKDSQLTWLLERDKNNTLAVDRFTPLVSKIQKVGFQSSDCKGAVTGTIQVDSHLYSFNNEPSSTGHYFGVKKKVTWMWANCVNFIEDEEALFEGISISPNRFMASVPFFSLYWQGTFYNCKGFSASLIKYRQSKQNIRQWYFSFSSQGYLFDVTIEAKPDEMIVHTHAVTDEECIYTAITYCAHMVIRIFKKNVLVQTLSSKGASFEYSRPEPFSEVKRNYLGHYMSKQL